MELLAPLFQILCLLGVTVASVILMSRTKNILLTLFFTFGCISWLFSDLYWVTYGFLRPDTRMPFAASEIGECAVPLLFTAGLSSSRPSSGRKPVGKLVFGVLFMAANTALWIIWTGEWVQDIISAVAFGFLLYTLIIILDERKALSGTGYTILALSSVFAIILQAAATYIPAPTGKLLEYCGYAVLIPTCIWTIVLAVKACISKEESNAFILSLTAFIWNIMSLYLSSGIVYSVILTFISFDIVIMYFALRKEVLADDLC